MQYKFIQLEGEFHPVLNLSFDCKIIQYYIFFYFYKFLPQLITPSYIYKDTFCVFMMNEYYKISIWKRWVRTQVILSLYNNLVICGDALNIIILIFNQFSMLWWKKNVIHLKCYSLVNSFWVAWITTNIFADQKNKKGPLKCKWNNRVL